MFCNRLSIDLCFQPEEWYSVAISDLKELGMPSSLNRKKLVELLAIKYPDIQWDRAYLLRGRYAQQQRLEKAVRALFQVRRERGRR